jgi:hypothetical protein
VEIGELLCGAVQPVLQARSDLTLSQGIGCQNFGLIKQGGRSFQGTHLSGDGLVPFVSESRQSSPVQGYLLLQLLEERLQEGVLTLQLFIHRAALSTVRLSHMRVHSLIWL